MGKQNGQYDFSAFDEIASKKEAKYDFSAFDEDVKKRTFWRWFTGWRITDTGSGFSIGFTGSSRKSI